MKDSLGDRMKSYEDINRQYLIKRMPVIIRIDGKAFHSFTKGFERPFSYELHNCMVQTTKYLIDNTQNCVLGYTQSDEISLLLKDWTTFETDQWFAGNVQKISSVSASLATGIFNSIINTSNLAFFDSRVFNLTKEEVCNYFIWRQQDASRNSVQMLGRAYFSHKELHKKNNSDIQDMLMLERGVNWNDIETWKKRGTCVNRDTIDIEIPIFTQDREYIERLL